MININLNKCKVKGFVESKYYLPVFFKHNRIYSLEYSIYKWIAVLELVRIVCRIFDIPSHPSIAYANNNLN